MVTVTQDQTAQMVFTVFKEIGVVTEIAVGGPYSGFGHQEHPHFVRYVKVE
jgi:hypothetical protein